MEDEKEVALLPVYFKKKGELKFSFHPSITPYNSPQFIRPEKIADARWEKNKFYILETLEEFVKSNYVYPYFFLDVNLVDVRPFTWNSWQVNPAFTFLVVPSEAKLDSDISRRSRNCLKDGYKVSFDWNPQVFIDLFGMTMERQKIEVSYKKSEMLKFLNDLKDSGIAWMCSTFDSNGNAHACWVQLQSRDSVVYNWNSATNLSFENSGGTSLLVDQLLNKLIAEKVLVWDLCGADNQSVVGFKSKLGGVLKSYFKAAFNRYSIKKKIYFRWMNR
ncbi:MAG: hypothetical protein IPO63_12470 [Bacteroidetes bacterium]|nr:hypothetical protein [Bacteroidota bacterium]